MANLPNFIPLSGLAPQQPKKQPDAGSRSSATPDFIPLGGTSRSSTSSTTTRPVSSPTLDLSEIDKEIAAKRAQIAERQKKIDAAKAKQAADAKYRKENPILSRLGDALMAGDAERQAVQTPQFIQRTMIPLKQDLAALERLKADSIKQGKAIAPVTTGELVAEGGKSLVRGPIRAVSDIASAAGIFGSPGEYVAKGVEGFGESIIEGLGIKQNENMKYSGTGQRLGQVGELTGGTLAFLPLEAVNIASKAVGASRALRVAGKGAKAAELSMAAGTGARQARETMDAYEERTGEKLSPVTRSAVQVGGSIVGSAFMLPIKSIMSKAPPEVSAAAGQEVTGILAQLGQSRIGKSEAVTAIKQVLERANSTAVGRTVTKGVIPAGAVVGGMQAGQNILEMGYNPEQRSLAGLGEGVGEAVLSGMVGGGVARGTVEGLQVRKNTKLNAQRQRILDDLAEQDAIGQEQEGQDYGTFDVVSRDAAGKVQREQVKVISEPDENGQVTVQRADGTRSEWNIGELKTKNAAPGSTRAVPLPDTMSRQAIADRIRNSLGNFEPDEHLNAFIKKTADQVGDAVILGRPEAPENYLADQEGRVSRKRKISEESRIGHSLVLDEARRVLNEYTDLLTTPPESTVPTTKPIIDPNTGETIVPSSGGETSSADSAPAGEIIQNRALAMREENARRTEMLDRVANDPNAIDKLGAFEDMLDQSGYKTPSPHEVAHLHDAMRLAAERETALNLTGARVEDIRAQEQRKIGADRVNIIEEHLYDPDITANEKLDKIKSDLEARADQAGASVIEPLKARLEDAQAQLKAEQDTFSGLRKSQLTKRDAQREVVAEATNELERLKADLQAARERAQEESGYKQLSEDEANRYQAVADAIDAYGPKGERQQKLDEIMANPRIKNKYDAFRKRVGEPNEQEAALLGSGTAAIEAQIKPAAEQPVIDEPTTIERGQAPDRSAEIVAEAEAANQRLADASLRAEQSRAEVDRINTEIEAEQAKLDAQPHMGTPAARKAINALKGLDAERIAAEEAAAVAAAQDAERLAAEEAAPKVDPKQVLDDAYGDALAAVEDGGHNEMVFIAGVEDIRNGREPLDIQEFAEEFSFVEPGEKLKFSVEDRPVDRAYLDYASGVDWARERVARAEEAGSGAPKVETKPVEEAAVEVAPVEEVAPKVEEAAPKVEAAPKPVVKAEPDDIIMGEPERGGLNKPADQAARASLARNWRMASWYKDFVFQFGGGAGAENALLKSLGINKLPNNLSVKDRLEMLITNRNGMIREINRQFINPISKETTRLYKEYGIHADEISDALQARAAAQRNAKVGLADGAGMTNPQAEAYLTNLKLSNKLQKMGKIIQLHDALRTRMQDIAVENGLISRKAMDKFIAEEPDYTPFKGRAEKGDMLADETTHQDYGKPEFVRKGMGVNRNIVRKAEGRSSLAANSLVNLMADAQLMAMKAADNKPAQTLLDLMEAHPDQMADMVEVVPKPGTDTLTVMRDGKAVNLQFKDTPAGDAMKSAFTEIKDPIKRAKWVEKFDRVSSLLRGVNTTMSPLFWPKALWKDSMDAIEFVLSEKGMKDSPLQGKKGVTRATIKYAKPFGETWRGVFDYLTDATPKTAEGKRLKQMLAEMVENGGTAGYAFREQAQNIREQMQKAYDRLDATGTKKAFLETDAGRKQLMETIHGINDFIDMVPRAAVYRAATEAGVPPKQAAKIALEASLNLPRRGRFGSTIDMVKWYTNAGIQSTAKKGRMLQSANGRKILAAHMLMGSAVAMWNITVAGDKNKDGKNDYLQLPAWRKAMGLTIYSPSGETAVTIPIGFMGSFETYLGQKLAEVAYGITSPNDGAAELSGAPAEIAKGFISSQLPLGRSFTSIESPDDLLGLVMPDPLAPIENIRTNKNAFGEAIYNEPFNKEQAKSSVPRASTPQGYKDLASWLNDNSNGHGKFAGYLDSSPETWKYLIDQYTGGVGKFVGSVAQLKNPFEGQYVVDESRAAATGYYEVSPRMKQVKEAFGPTGSRDRDTIEWLKENRPVESSPRVRGAYSIAEKQLDGIKAREARFKTNKLPPQQKQVVADKIEADKQAIFARFLRVYNAELNKR